MRRSGSENLRCQRIVALGAENCLWLVTNPIYISSSQETWETSPQVIYTLSRCKCHGRKPHLSPKQSLAVYCLYAYGIFKQIEDQNNLKTLIDFGSDFCKRLRYRHYALHLHATFWNVSGRNSASTKDSNISQKPFTDWCICVWFCYRLPVWWLQACILKVIIMKTIHTEFCSWNHGLSADLSYLLTSALSRLVTNQGMKVKVRWFQFGRKGPSNNQYEANFKN